MPFKSYIFGATIPLFISHFVCNQPRVAFSFKLQFNCIKEKRHACPFFVFHYFCYIIVLLKICFICNLYNYSVTIYFTLRFTCSANISYSSFSPISPVTSRPSFWGRVPFYFIIWKYYCKIKWHAWMLNSPSCAICSSGAMSCM